MATSGFCFTFTISDHTKPARSLLDLLTNGTGNGYTVVGNAPSLSVTGSVAYLSVQSSNGNSAQTVYKGDENVANDGTRQGKELLAGDADVQQAYPYSIYLGEIFIRASADGAIVNVEAHLA